ncbi:hypothetical protein GJAV_G00148480 [Gymnothorax javanicus]|nr:hypothetical protein GJAV_G00148480 [Gymnothorax javanicus]
MDRSTLDALLAKLLQLECHFTWGLKDIELNDLQNRLKYNTELSGGDDRNIGWSYNFLAFTKYMQGLLEEALGDLEQAEYYIKGHHGDNCKKQLIVTYSNFAWVYYHKGDHMQSQSYLDKLDEIKIEFPSGSPSILHPEVYGEKGKAFLSISQQYYDRAKECFVKALELQPEEIEWNEGYAVALFRTEFNLTSFEDSPASKQLRRVLELDPNNAHVMALLGLKYAHYKENEKAKELLERAMMLDPDKPYVTRHVAKFYRNSGMVKESISLLKRALETTPDSSVLHHQLGLSYDRKHSTVKDKHSLRLSIQHIEQAISLKPSFILAMVDLGRLYASAEDYRKAEEMFKKATEVASSKNEEQQMVTLRYGNFLLHQKKSLPLAVEKYKEGLQLKRDTLEWKACARNLENIANNQIARNCHDGEAFGILGFVYQMRGQKQQAIECYEKAIIYDPDNEQHLTALCDLRLSMQ